jgi:16S rRNA (guanine527-N7)-methyltransferase
MSISPRQVAEAAQRWQLASSVSEDAAARLAAYGNLLMRWNSRIALTAIRDEEELVARHLMEGAFAAAHHPPARTVLDFGSGTGVPGIPIAICCLSFHVTLAESQRKKAAFLQEAVRQLRIRASVHAGRAENLVPHSFDAVWMRAVERQAEMLPRAAVLVAPNGRLCVLSGLERPALSDWGWQSTPIPDSECRVLHIGVRH